MKERGERYCRLNVTSKKMKQPGRNGGLVGREQVYFFGVEDVDTLEMGDFMRSCARWPKLLYACMGSSSP